MSILSFSFLLLLDIFSVSAFDSLVSIPTGVSGFAARLQICATTAGIKKYVSIIMKKREKHGEIILQGKTKLDTIDFVVSKSLIDPYINHDEFIVVNNKLRKYNEMKEEIKKPETLSGIHNINMVDISRKTYKRKAVEAKVDMDGVLWLNEKFIEEGLDNKNLQVITVKYPSGYRKRRYELVDEPKNNGTEFLYTKN